MVDSLRRKPDFAWRCPNHHDILRGGVRRANDAEANQDSHLQEMSQLFHRMEFGFDALLRAPDAPPLDHIDAITISPHADEAYEQQARAATESMDPSAAGQHQVQVLPTLGCNPDCAFELKPADPSPRATRFLPVPGCAKAKSGSGTASRLLHGSFRPQRIVKDAKLHLSIRLRSLSNESRARSAPIPTPAVGTAAE
jgi:hypothetical protein